MYFSKFIKGIENEIMHVGDLLEPDITGAAATEMKTVWFNREKSELKSNIKFNPDYEIKRLSQLLKVIKL